MRSLLLILTPMQLEVTDINYTFSSSFVSFSFISPPPFSLSVVKDDV